MNDKTNNQLAQVCNNLYCIIYDTKKYLALSASVKLNKMINDLDAQYNTLFKLIYGND